MHEISLVQGLLQQLAELAEQNNMTKVLSVTMNIGPLAGVVEDSFKFGFDILTAEDELVKGAKLVLLTTPVSYRCTECNNIEQSTTTKPDCCPKCGEVFLIPEGGNDLILQSVEME